MAGRTFAARQTGPGFPPPDEPVQSRAYLELRRQAERDTAFALVILGLWLAANSAFPATNQIQYLSGPDKDHTVPWEFRVSAGCNPRFWTNLPVPSCWRTKGFGSYESGNDSTSEFGAYRHAFTIPAGWATQRVFLIFKGAMTDTEVRGTDLTVAPWGDEFTTPVAAGASNAILAIALPAPQP